MPRTVRLTPAQAEDVLDGLDDIIDRLEDFDAGDTAAAAKRYRRRADQIRRQLEQIAQP